MRISDWSSDVCSSDLEALNFLLDQSMKLIGAAAEGYAKGDFEGGKFLVDAASDLVKGFATGQLDSFGAALGHIPPGLFDGKDLAHIQRNEIVSASVRESSVHPV